MRCGPTAARALDRDRPSCPVGAQHEAHAIRAGRLDRLGTDVGVGREPIAQAARRRARTHPADDRVIGIEDCDAVGRERLQQFALGRLDGLDRTDPRQVDRLDRRDDADPRPGDPGELGDLAADVHPHLEDDGLVLRAETEQGEWQPDLVVLVALVAKRPETAPEDGRDGLLGRRLGDAPRDPDHDRLEPAPPAGRDGAERRQRIDDPDDRHVTECCRVGRRSRDDEGSRSPADRVGQVGVTVGPFTGKRHEELPGCHEPGVDRGAADRSGGPGEQPAAGQADQLVGREGGTRGESRRLGRRVDVGHGRQCRTGRDHRSERTGSGGRSATRSGVVIASVAMRRKSSNDITGISNRPTLTTVGLASSMRIATTRSGTPV